MADQLNNLFESFGFAFFFLTMHLLNHFSPLLTAYKASYNPVNQKFFVGILRTEMISTATTTTIGVAATTCYNAIGSTTCLRKEGELCPNSSRPDDSTPGVTPPRLPERGRRRRGRQEHRPGKGPRPPCPCGDDHSHPNLHVVLHRVRHQALPLVRL
ncbi:uncharacterized protein LOC119569608 [Penaeus monodon]|uniref:uncharacterized protein LOC119569608 n=1 Tax=Penaeus monodon TaxID=6687 RepID=UPI0018A7923A|nr:uncharacterized protein LOC119569608 [Penaeus monodon]